jgi:tetratricopeptide (TPR) repeat protein
VAKRGTLPVFANLGRLRPFLACFLLLACSGGIPAVLAGELQWVEVRSPNFSVVTDAGEKRGREVALRFEQMRAVFGILMTKAKVNLPIPLQIVAFRNTKELLQFAPLFNGKPTQVAGLFQASTDRSFIMLDMAVEDPWAVVFHEYAHQLMNGNLSGDFPPWFEEGFAEYFSSIEADNKQVRVGKVPDYEYMILRQDGMMKIADLFRVQQNSLTYNENGDHRSTFYAESGMLMHYIYDNKLIPKVAAYFDLMENKHAPVEAAIQQAFGMSPAQFDKALGGYVSQAHYLFYPIPTPANLSSTNYTATPLKAADAKAVLADIHLHSRDYQDQAFREFQEILKSDPSNMAACRGLGYAYLQRQDFDQAGEYFKRAAQLDSRDARVHYYYALMMVRKNGFGSSADLPAMTKELETSLSLEPDFADSYALLAFTQSGSGDPAKALITMQKALAISPRNQSYLYNLANLYLANRQPDLAITVLQSLQVTDNPALAAQAAIILAQARQFRDAMQTGVAGHIATSAPHEEQKSADNVAPGAVVASSRPAKFLKGTLIDVDCATPPLAVLTITSGTKTWKMNVSDWKQVVLIGADEFSCSWKKQKVAINYGETAEGEASVISLEIQ